MGMTSHDKGGESADGSVDESPRGSRQNLGERQQDSNAMDPPIYLPA